MVKRTALVVLALASSFALLGCQPEGERAAEQPGAELAVPGVAQTPGEHFERAYTDMTQVHANLVQGNWDEARDQIGSVRENLQQMRDADEPISQAQAEQVNALLQDAQELTTMIDNRNTASLEQAQRLANRFTENAQLAAIGVEGGGAGATEPATP